MTLASEQALDCPDKWPVARVADWLKLNNFGQYVDLFCVEHKLCGSGLLTLTEDDLRSPPLQLTVLGDIKRLSIALRRLQLLNSAVVHSLLNTNTPTSHNESNSIRNQYNLRSNGDVRRDRHCNDLSGDSDVSSLDEEDDDFVPSQRSSDHGNNGHGHSRPELKPEAWKALLAMVYFFTVTWITAIVMVIVHDRVPDMQTYPPLPDIFLDNVPLIPWAFDICELCGLILFIIWCTILVLHKHRFVPQSPTAKGHQ